MARQGSITTEDQEFVETWENIATYGNAIIKLNPKGEEIAQVISQPGTFMLTTEERILTEAKVVDVKNDPFLNGAFRPVVVPENVNIQTNPNALSDDEIQSLFESSDFAFDEWMSTIDSSATLLRMLDLAEKYDNLTMRRLRAIKERLVVVKPGRVGPDGVPRASVASNDPEVQKFLKEGGSGSRTIRGAGGRSTDYR